MRSAAAQTKTVIATEPPGFCHANSFEYKRMPDVAEVVRLRVVTYLGTLV
jgi:hypothetical protein